MRGKAVHRDLESNREAGVRMADLSTLANLAQAAAVMVAVAFGIYQVRQLGKQRRRDAAFTLMSSLQTRPIVEGLALLDTIPEGLSGAELRERLGDGIHDLNGLLATWESLGILVFHGEVGLDLVDDFFSGSIVHSWRKLGPFVEGLRTEIRRDTRWEWFQWLAERMIERESNAAPVPAHVQHRHWPG